MNPRQQANFGSLLILGSVLWALYVAINNNFGFQDGTHNNLFTLLFTKGPVELCIGGVLVWLLAKWRDATKMR
jgi:hypothetical protein